MTEPDELDRCGECSHIYGHHTQGDVRWSTRPCWVSGCTCGGWIGAQQMTQPAMPLAMYVWMAVVSGYLTGLIFAWSMAWWFPLR